MINLIVDLMSEEEVALLLQEAKQIEVQLTPNQAAIVRLLVQLVLK